MATLQTVNKNELIIIRKAAIFLRDKLLMIDRDGPLVKLLNREIELINDELSSRKTNTLTQELPVTGDLKSKE